MANNIISCDHLCLGYGRKALTEPINLKIKANQWLGIVGENGIGKSTFFKTILGILPYLSGTITVLGNPPGKLNHKISYIPQERTLNITDNLSGMSLIKANYRASRFGLPSFGKQLHQRIHYLLTTVGAESYAKKPLHALSGGQKKRIFLAQALINNPRLLLLDEPLSDLDPQAKHDVIQALKRIHHQENITLLIISHDMHDIAHELDHFIHFKNRKTHFCDALPCLREDANVRI